MPDFRWMGKAVAAVVVMVAAMATANEANQGDPPVQTLKARRIIVTQAPKDAAAPQTVVIKGDNAGDVVTMINAPRSEYWIGAQCGSLPAALRAHLDVPEKQGVLVLDVVPDGPAAKAGIKRYDVLLKLADAPVGDVAELVKRIDEAKGKELTVALLREGKPKTVQLTPAKRPDEPVPPTATARPGQAEMDRLYEWFDRSQPGAGGRPPMRLRFFHPGMILPPGAPVHPPLPGNMSISITKQGEEPAKIVVKRGEDTWEVTEKELDKLPADVQPHVRRMVEGATLGPDVLIPRFDFVPDWSPLPPGGIPEAQQRLREHVQQQLDRMNQQMKELQERVERLRDQPAPETQKQSGPDAEKQPGPEAEKK